MEMSLPVHITVDGTNVYEDVRADYEIADLQDVEVVIDLGAHIGAFALYAHELFPEATIIGVEPDPTNFAKLVENTNGIANIYRLHAAVTDHGGETQFAGGRDTGGVVTPGGDVTVRATTLDELLGLFGSVSILKADIEGSEFVALPASTQLDRVRYLALEVHLHGRHEARQGLWDFLIPTFNLTSEERFVRADMPGAFEVWRGFHR